MRQRLASNWRVPACLAAACATAAFVVPTSPSAGAQARSNAVPRAASANRFGTALWAMRQLGPDFMSSPVIATIDDVKAVVLATLSGEIYVVNARTGAELPGWPQFVHINSPTPTGVDSSPAVAYLDGPDKPPSIIVGAGSLYRRDQQGGLEAFYANGRVRFVFQTAPHLQPLGRTGRLLGPRVRNPGGGRHNRRRAARHRLRLL